jgi:preprotein translocase subunit YajC
VAGRRSIVAVRVPGRGEVRVQKIQADMIQPGWEVWTSGGEMLGRVVRIEGSTLAVKKEGLLGGEILVPRDAVRDVEERRVEVELSDAT